MCDVNKNIISVEKKDHSAFEKRLTGFEDCDYHYKLELLDLKTLSGQNLCPVFSFIPTNKNHIELVSGNYPQNKYEVLVSEKLYNSLNNEELIVLNDNEIKVKVSGIVKNHIFLGETLYFSKELKDDLQNIKDIYTLDIETMNLTKDYEMLRNDYNVYSEILERSENYSTLLKYGKIIGYVLIMMSFFISVLLYSIVSAIIFDLRKHDICYLKTLGMSDKRIYKLLLKLLNIKELI